MTLSSDLPLLLPITALLPLTAILLVAQTNPYQTLVLRGILGALAALLYALLGAADVALTEALVGSLLSTTLYAVALRSSMVLRLGCADPQTLPDELIAQLRSWLEPANLRLELVTAAPSPNPSGARMAEQADLHGLLEWQPGSIGLLLLHNPHLRTKLSSLCGSSAWQPRILPLELTPEVEA